MNKNILYQIKTLEKLVVRNLLEEKEIQCLPTPTQMQIIEYIENQQEEVYQKDLEKKLNLRRATISGVLKTMEKNHIIKREESLIDGRTKKIVLSPEAKDIFEKKQLQIHTLEQKLIQNIKEEDLQNFEKVLDQMIANIQERKKIC